MTDLCGYDDHAQAQILNELLGIRIKMIRNHLKIIFCNSGRPLLVGMQNGLCHQDHNYHPRTNYGTSNR